jgi:hypothetical protein
MERNSLIELTNTIQSCGGYLIARNMYRSVSFALVHIIIIVVALVTFLAIERQLDCTDSSRLLKYNFLVHVTLLLGLCLQGATQKIYIM